MDVEYYRGAIYWVLSRDEKLDIRTTFGRNTSPKDYGGPKTIDLIIEGTLQLLPLIDNGELLT